MMQLSSGTSLASITKERHAQESVYILSDPRDREWLLLAQKLPCLVEYINRHIDGTHQRLSSATLYDAASGRTKGERTGKLIKYRWAIDKVARRDAVARFESLRACGFATVGVLGDETCYHVR